MKKFVLYIFLINLSIYSNAQTIEWSKSEPLRGNVVQKNCIAVDEDGNTIIAGRGYYGGIYILKYDATGNKLWEHQYIGNNRSIKSLLVDNDGNIIFLIHAPKITINGIFYEDSPLIKYNPAGDVIWAKIPGGNGRKYGFTTISSADGQGFYGAGSFVDTVYLENNIVLQDPSGNGKFFLAYFNNEGECQWALADEGSLETILYDSNDSAFFTSCYFPNSVTLGQGVNQVTFYNQNGSEYQAKYTNTGELLWAKQLNSNLIAPDSTGNFYAFERDTDFLQLGKYDETGTLLWKRSKLKAAGYKLQMAISNQGDIFISGGFSNQMIINDSISITGSASYHTFFVAKFDSTGEFKWITTNIGSGGATAKAISVGDDNSIYITGDMQGEVTFGGQTLNEPYGGIFTLKISDDEVASIPEINNSSTFLVYPNPTSNTVSICYTSKADNNLILTIKNQLGQLFLTKSYSAQKEINETIDLSGYSKGIYFIEIIADKKKEARKIILN